MLTLILCLCLVIYQTLREFYPKRHNIELKYITLRSRWELALSILLINACEWLAIGDRRQIHWSSSLVLCWGLSAVPRCRWSWRRCCVTAARHRPWWRSWESVPALWSRGSSWQSQSRTGERDGPGDVLWLAKQCVKLMNVCFQWL